VQGTLPLWDDVERREVSGHVSTFVPIVNLRGLEVELLCPGCQNHGVGRVEETEVKEGEWRDFENVFREGLVPVRKTRRETARGSWVGGRRRFQPPLGGETLPF
jgi:hypothetical protein